MPPEAAKAGGTEGEQKAAKHQWWPSAAEGPASRTQIAL